MTNKGNKSAQKLKWYPLMIPAGIRKAVEKGEISIAEAYVYSEIESLNGIEGCYATNAHIAKKCGISERSVSRSIASLTEKELIYYFPNDGVISGRTLRTRYREENRKKKRR